MKPVADGTQFNWLSDSMAYYKAKVSARELYSRIEVGFSDQVHISKLDDLFIRGGPSSANHTSNRPLNAPRGIFNSSGAKRIPNSDGAQGIPDSYGAQGIPTSDGVQGIPISNRAQGISNSDRAQEIPNSDGAPGIPNSDGAQGIPDSDGDQGIPKSRKS